MFFKKRKKKRVICPAHVIIEHMIIDSLEIGIVADIEISYKGEAYNLGVTSEDPEFDNVNLKTKRRNLDYFFYINWKWDKALKKDTWEQRFDSLETFKKEARLGAELFMELNEDIEVRLSMGEVPWVSPIFDDYIVIEENV